MSKKQSWIFITDWYPRETDNFNGIFIANWLRFLQDEADFTAIVWRAKQSKNQLLIHPTSFGKEIIIETKSGIAGSWWQWLKYRKQIKNELPQNYRILLAPLPWSFVIKKFVFGKEKYILSEHQSVYFTPYFNQISFWKKWLYLKGLNDSSEIIAVSSALKNQIEKISPESRIHVIPNRVEVQPKSKFKKQKRIAIIGDVRDEVKGISQALEWCSIVFPNFELCVVGDGPDLISIKKKFKSVTFHSAMTHDSLMDFIEESSVVVINSPFETFSILASEVQQLGTYLLCRKNGGPEDFASNQVLWFSSEKEFKLGANLISQRIEQNQHPLPFQNDLLKGERIIEMWKEVLQ